MSCSSCSGFMLEDHFLDFEGSYGEFWAKNWRCVNCGHVDDAVVERNRLAHREKTYSFREPNHQKDRVPHRVKSCFRDAA